MSRKRKARNRGFAVQSVGNVFRVMLSREYKLGGNGVNIDKPFDCVGMLVEYTKRRYRKDIVEKIEAFNEDYVDVYNLNKEYAMSLFEPFLDETFAPVVREYMMPGDIIIVEADGKISIGIYGGNSHMMITSEETGCVTIGVNFYKVIKAYRWPL